MYRIDLMQTPYTTDSGRVKQSPGSWTHRGWNAPANILVIMLAGSCEFTFPEEGRVIAPSAGQAVLIPRGVFYRGSCRQACEYYFFHFYSPVEALEEETARSSYAAAFARAQEADPHRYFRHIPTVFDQMYMYEVTDVSAVMGKLVALLAECDAEVHKDDMNRMIRLAMVLGRIVTTVCEAAMGRMERRAYPPSLERILTYLYENYTEPITLQSLSQRFGLSKQYIIRLFRRHLGTTVTRFINDLKLSHAPELLCQSALNISQIADHLGFSSAHYFSRLFREKYSVSPSRFQPEQRIGKR